MIHELRWSTHELTINDVQLFPSQALGFGTKRSRALASVMISPRYVQHLML
jgi:hypothetical protein